MRGRLRTRTGKDVFEQEDHCPIGGGCSGDPAPPPKYCGNTMQHSKEHQSNTDHNAEVKKLCPVMRSAELLPLEWRAHPPGCSLSHRCGKSHRRSRVSPVQWGWEKSSPWSRDCRLRSNRAQLAQAAQVPPTHLPSSRHTLWGTTTSTSGHPVEQLLLQDDDAPQVALNPQLGQ